MTVYEYEHDVWGRPQTLTRAVTTQVESAWDDTTRTKALALARHDVECCSGCGTHRTILEDPENNVMVPDESTCPVCAGLATYGRVKAAEDARVVEALGKEPDPKAPRPTDGRSLFLRRATEEELAERSQKGGGQHGGSSREGDR